MSFAGKGSSLRVWLCEDFFDIAALLLAPLVVIDEIVREVALAFRLGGIAQNLVQVRLDGFPIMIWQFADGQPGIMDEHIADAGNGEDRSGKWVSSGVLGGGVTSQFVASCRCGGGRSGTQDALECVWVGSFLIFND